MIAVVDACVLFSPLQRELMLLHQAAGLVQLHWSERLLEEWQRAARRAGLAEGILAAELARLTDRAPRALLSVDPAPSYGLPDSDDEHVLAAALTARASLIITLNLRDFPPHVLRPMGLQALTPDQFSRQMPARELLRVLHALRAAAPPELQSPEAFRQNLKRHRLPRLAKFWRENVIETGVDAVF